jgi:hypothetical protein
MDHERLYDLFKMKYISMTPQFKNLLDG